MSRNVILKAQSKHSELFSYPGDVWNETKPLWFYSLRARRVDVRFLRVLGRGKRIFKDSVRLIAHYYSQSKYDKPL